MNRQFQNKKQRLYLALRFPDLCLRALGFSHAEHGEIIVDKEKVFYATEQAKQKGVALGMNVNSAELLCGREALPRNIKLERQSLQKLAANLYQFTPYIEEYVCGYEYGLFLEVSQCLSLFNGIKALSQQVSLYLEKEGYGFQLSLAHTAKGAWMLSYKDYPINGLEDRSTFIRRLQKVPLKYFREYAAQVEQLAKSGFYCLGDVARQIDTTNVGSLKRRFDRGFIEAVCEIFDIEKNLQQVSLFEKPRTLYKPKEDFFDAIYFDYPVKTVTQLKPALKKLLENLEKYFIKRQCEFKKIRWFFYDIHSDKCVMDIQCAYPQIATNMLYELSCIKLDSKNLPFEVDALALCCDSYSVIQNRNRGFSFSGCQDKQSSEEDFSLTATKLAMFLGESSIFKISYQDSHVPEASNCIVNIDAAVNQQLPVLQRKSIRPSWLFNSPYPISIKKEGLYWQGYISLVSKAERVDTLWWEQGVTRDYFVAKRKDNLYLWVFLDLKENAWYVQGVFS